MSAWLRYAGLVAAPAAWAVSTQAGQILPYVDCGRQASWTPLTATLSCALAIAAGAISMAGRSRLAATQRFLAGLGGLLGLAFAFALLLQAVASSMLDPCAR